MDATELQIQQPPTKKARLDAYGRKGHYAYKYQAWVRFPDGKIVGLYGPFLSTESDFSIYKKTIPQQLLPGEVVMGDKGYQGDPLHALTPFKRPRKRKGQPVRPLLGFQLRFNRLLRARRAHIERVFRRMKQFQILKRTWRHPLEKHPTVMAAIGKLVNEDLKVAPLFRSTPSYYFFRATIVSTKAR